MDEDQRLRTMAIDAELAEARATKRSLRQADAELVRVLKENEALWAENERLKAVIRSMPTTPQTKLQAKVALGHTPTRDEIIESMKTPADDCAFHMGALGERCESCGDVVDGTSKEQRTSLREEIADHVLKDWRKP
jgi:regulator of replication initiation timing